MKDACQWMVNLNGKVLEEFVIALFTILTRLVQGTSLVESPKTKGKVTAPWTTHPD